MDIYMKHTEGLWHKWIHFAMVQDRGNYWVTLFKSFLNIGQTASQTATWKIIFWGIGWNIPIWAIALFIWVKDFFMMYIIPYVVGKWDWRNGYQKKQNTITQANENLSPFNAWLVERIQEIYTELGMKDKFKKP
jgi:hypothetical protein